MDCNICLYPFDCAQRRPKSLPCGHSFCLLCLEDPKRGKKCPLDQKTFQGDASALPTNYQLGLLSLMEEFNKEKPARPWYCSTCRGVATESCEDSEHSLLRPKPALQRQVQQLQEQLPQLQQDVQQQLQGLAAATEQQAVEGLKVLGAGPGRSCEVVLQQDGGPTYRAKWTLSEQDSHKDKLLRILILLSAGQFVQMDCYICLYPFDCAQRRPKSLPCGHSFCLLCLEDPKRGKKCPLDQKTFQGDASALPTNYQLLSLMEEFNKEKPARRWYCSTCRGVATESCEDSGHSLLRPKPALQRQVQQLQEQLPQLQQDVQQQLQGLAAATEQQAVEGLKVLGAGPGRSCEVVLQQNGGPTYRAKWTLSEQDSLKDKLLRILILLSAGQFVQEQQRDEEVVQQEQEEVLLEREEEVVQPRSPGIEQIDVETALYTEGKPALLQRVQLQGVRRLTRVLCIVDPAWMLQLLQAAAPLLEELEVCDVRAEHLLALHGMPRLRGLDVNSNTIDHLDFPAALPPLPEGHAGLQWLLVLKLPRQTTISLLQLHSHSLQELWLWVGTGRCEEIGWPWSCEDLDSLLQQCGLRALQRLVLDRPKHSEYECPAQLAAVRRVLPGVTVQCNDCDKLGNEPF